MKFRASRAFADHVEITGIRATADPQDHGGLTAYVEIRASRAFADYVEIVGILAARDPQENVGSEEVGESKATTETRA